MATYQQNMFDGASEGYVKYTIEPDFGTPIAPGETVTISGTAYWRDSATRSISVYIIGFTTIYANCNIAKGKAGSFRISFAMPEFQTASARETKCPIEFTLWDAVGDGANGSGTFKVSGQEITYLTHRFDPMVLAMEFGRCDAAGNWDNAQGQYIRCDSLRISKNAKAALSELTTATISCTDESGAVVKTVTLDTTKHLTPAFSDAGYSETAPGIFAGFVTQLGMNYTLTLTLADAYDRTTATSRVVRCFARLHLSGAKNGGVAVGMFSTSTDGAPKFEVADTHEAFFYGGINNVTNYALGDVATGGHWIDGKPIYRLCKRISTTIAKGTASAYQSVTLFDHPYDNIINYQLLKINNSNGKIEELIPYVYLDVYFQNGTQIVIVHSASRSAAALIDLYAIVDYTRADSSSDPALPEGPEIMDDPYVDAGVARADYIAMMSGIEIPADAEATDSVQADATGTESPGIEGEAPSSEKFATVELYYSAGCWNEKMVKNAAGKWITLEEAEQILTTQKEGE